MTRAAVGFIHGTGKLIASAILTNPQPNDVLVDTGPLDSGNYLFSVQGYTDAAFKWELQYRDASNATTKQFIRRNEAAGNIDLLVGVKLTDVLVNERVRVVCVTSPGGANTVQTTLEQMEMG